MANDAAVVQQTPPLSAKGQVMHPPLTLRTTAMHHGVRVFWKLVLL
jgi:hypothetical protein